MNWPTSIEIADSGWRCQTALREEPMAPAFQNRFPIILVTKDAKVILLFHRTLLDGSVQFQGIHVRLEETGSLLNHASLTLDYGAILYSEMKALLS